MEAARNSERVQQLEREKSDSVAAERKKLEALEISKNNEIEKLQVIHRYVCGALLECYKVRNF